QDLEAAQRKGDLAKAGELAYGVIPGLEKEIKQVETQGGGQLVKEEVTEENIAAVVSRWTGIPVDKMLAGEREKLLKMEEAIGARRVGQGEAVKAVSTAVRRARRFAGSKPPDRLVPLLRPNRRRQDG